MKSQTTFTPDLTEAEFYTREIIEDFDHKPETIRSINPRDRTLIGEVELTATSKAEELIEQAREAQRAWMRRPLDRRLNRAKAVTQEVLNWRKDLLELLIDETGKSKIEARQELWNACQETRHIARETLSRLGPVKNKKRLSFSPGWTATWEPLGTVLIIASAYEPLHTTLAPAIAALIAGNAVLVVSDRRAPLTVQSVANIAATAGVPDALWQSITCDPPLIKVLASQVDAVVSYGEASLTKEIARQQGPRMIPILGRWNTQDAMIVLNDADVEEAAKAAVRAACTGGGRGHRTLRRIYVQELATDPFIDAVVEEVGALRQLPQSDPEQLEMSPLFEPGDLEKMERLIEEAITAGARLIAGGRRRPKSRGLYFEPTVLSHMDESMALWQEDAPGPIVAIATVRSFSEAQMRIRKHAGHSAVSLFTKTPELAKGLAKRLDASAVGVNKVVEQLPINAPMIRACKSGAADPIGAARLQALSRQALTMEARQPIRHLHALLRRTGPAQKERLLDGLITLTHRQGWTRKAVELFLSPR